MNNLKTEKLFDLDLISLQEFADAPDSILDDVDNSQATGKKYIVFMLDETLFAIASHKVSEVVRTMPYTTLPNVPEWLLGIANLRGDIITIIDLHTFWKLKPNDSPKSKLIILRSENSNSQIAFKVDKLREIATLPDNEIQIIGKDDLPYLCGKINLKSNNVNLIDVEDVVASLKLN